MRQREAARSAGRSDGAIDDVTDVHLLEEPLQGIETAALHQSQGAGSGMSAIFGKWPGDETDEVIAAALAELS